MYTVYICFKRWVLGILKHIEYSALFTLYRLVSLFKWWPFFPDLVRLLHFKGSVPGNIFRHFQVFFHVLYENLLGITYDCIFIPRFWIPFTLDVHPKHGHRCWIHNAESFGNCGMLVCSHQIDLLGGQPFLEIAPRETNHHQVLLHVHGVECFEIYNSNKKHGISQWIQKRM